MSDSNVGKGVGLGVGLILGIVLAILLLIVFFIGGCALVVGGCAAIGAKAEAEKNEQLQVEASARVARELPPLTNSVTNSVSHTPEQLAAATYLAAIQAAEEGQFKSAAGLMNSLATNWPSTPAAARLREFLILARKPNQKPSLITSDEAEIVLSIDRLNR